MTFFLHFGGYQNGAGTIRSHSVQVSRVVYPMSVEEVWCQRGEPLCDSIKVIKARSRTRCARVRIRMTLSCGPGGSIWSGSGLVAVVLFGLRDNASGSSFSDPLQCCTVKLNSRSNKAHRVSLVRWSYTVLSNCMAELSVRKIKGRSSRCSGIVEWSK